jgi:hypothetical protein
MFTGQTELDLMAYLGRLQQFVKPSGKMGNEHTLVWYLSKHFMPFSEYISVWRQS